MRRVCSSITSGVLSGGEVALVEAKAIVTRGGRGAMYAISTGPGALARTGAVVTASLRASVARRQVAELQHGSGALSECEL